jgi:hypothetical protein
MDALAKTFIPATFGKTGLRPDWIAIATFVCGLTAARMVNLVGEVYVAELLLPQLAILVMVASRNTHHSTRNPAFGVLVQAAVLMLAGYIVSDLYRDTNPAQFLRGWARTIVLTLDFLALTAVVLRDKRYFWWFVFGFAVGALIQLKIRGVPLTDAAGWKFGYSTPLGYLMGALSCFLPVKLASLAFAGLGVFNVYMDFRIGGAICLMVACALWFRSSGAVGLTLAQSMRLIVAVGIAATILVAALVFTQEIYKSRREQSNQGREAGLVVAMRGIAESPLAGYGSWPTDPWLVTLYRTEAREGGVSEIELRKVGMFSAHSQMLQAWIEGGILAAFFWFVYGYWLIRAAAYSALFRPLDACSPVFLFILLYGIWDLIMTPFSSPSRLPIAMGIAIICICAGEMAVSRKPATRLVAQPA